jgi:hypothetical protein
VTKRLGFKPGATGLTLEGTPHVSETRRYIRDALAGQAMRVYVDPTQLFSGSMAKLGPS